MPRHSVWAASEVFTLIESLRPSTIIFDVEPLVAPWNTDGATLSDSVNATIAAMHAVPGLEVVVFVTTSAWRLGLAFVHFRLPREQTPAGPKLMAAVAVIVVQSVVVFNATVQLTLYTFQSQFSTQYNLLFMNMLLQPADRGGNDLRRPDGIGAPEAGSPLG